MGAVSMIALLGGAAIAAEPAEKSEGFEEIVVTATKRSQSLQDVSSSVSAFTSADIERLRLDSFEDFSRSVPGLTYNQAVKNRGLFNIRGITTSLFGGNTQDPVSVYINETPVTDTYGAIVQPDLRLFDVERVEVLRGPQGTLFGSGSLGGTVRVITKQPNLGATEAAGRIDLAVTDGGHWRQRYDAMVNVPVIEDELAVRVVGYYRDETGWVENITLGTKNSTEDWGGRVAVLWKPEQNFSMKLEVIHQDSDPEDGDAFNPDLGKFKKASAITEERPAELTNYGLTIEYDIEDFATLISATSYQESKTATFSDLGDLFGFGVNTYNISEPWNSEFITQELRLVSNTDSKFEWILGSFFIDRQTDPEFYITTPGLSDAFETIVGFPLPTDDIFVSPIITKSRELAAFGDVTYEVVDGVKLNGGLRVFDTKSSYEEPDRRTLNFATLMIDEMSFKNVGKDSDYTWRTGISYEPQDEYMFYANVSRGYRIGQVNPNKGPSLVDPDDIVIPELYGPDSSINYELGAKTAWLDKRLIVNVAAYYIDWKDIQVNGARVSDMRTFISNAGNAESYGLEVEMLAMPAQGLDLNLSFTLQDTKMTSIADGFIVAAGEGEELPGTVNFKMSGGVQYTWDVRSELQMYVRADGQYIGSSANDFFAGGANPFYAINEAYENISAAVGLVAEKWNLTVYGENLTNNDDHILTLGGGTPNYVNTLRPLTVGVRLGFKY